MSHSSASLFKLTSNALLAQRVSTVNCLAMICDRLNENAGEEPSSRRADMTDISRALSMSSKLGKSVWYQPGIGFGGSCLPKDTLALAAVCDNLGLANTVGDLFRTACTVNSIQIETTVHRILESLLVHRGRSARVVVWGYAYKAGTGDPRGSAARTIITHLLDAGVEVLIKDPNMTFSHIHSDLKHHLGDKFDQHMQAGKLLLPPAEALGDLYDLSNGLVVANAEPLFLNVTREHWEDIFKRMAAPKLVFDGRNCLDSAMLRNIGFTVVQVGR
jgi:UDPglucose 6-dehydrogenase